MKIIEAVWEKRNLGCRAFEVSLRKADLANVSSVISQLTTDTYADAFVTVKLPVGDLSAIHRLEEAGFRFVETQFQIGYDLSQYRCPQAVADFVSPVVQVEVTRNVESWKCIANMVTADLFRTDRISLDPCFGADVGCVRYKNWMLDLVFDENSRLYTFHEPGNSDKPIGFTLVKEEGLVSRAILGGVFSQCKVAGVGVSIWNQYLKNSALKGFTRIETAVSSNNPAVLVMDSVLGYVIEKMTYVMRKSARTREGVRNDTV